MSSCRSPSTSGHRLAERADIELAATTGETFADGPPSFGTRIAVDRAFAAAGLQRRVALEVNDIATLVDFVRHGLAAAFLPPSLVRRRARHHARPDPPPRARSSRPTSPSPPPGAERRRRGAAGVREA